MVEFISVLGLGAIALFLSAKVDVLKKENEGLRDRIKRDNEWHEIDKKVSVGLARVDERFKISKENYLEFCRKLDKI